MNQVKRVILLVVLVVVAGGAGVDLWGAATIVKNVRVSVNVVGARNIHLQKHHMRLRDKAEEFSIELETNEGGNHTVTIDADPINEAGFEAREERGRLHYYVASEENGMPSPQPLTQDPRLVKNITEDEFHSSLRIGLIARLADGSLKGRFQSQVRVTYADNY